MTDDRRILADQLEQALEDWSRGEGDALEVAALAGLLERFEGAPGPGTPEVARARAEREALQDELDLVDLEGMVDRLAELDEDSEPELVSAVLFDLDELGAAATFLGRPEVVQRTLELAARTVHAFPEVFAAQAPLASEILARRSPLPGDPALVLWRAVEVADAAVEAEPRAAVPPEALKRLGLPVVVSVGAVLSEPRRLAAADLPPPPAWTPVARGDGWEIALTVRDGVRIVVAAPDEVAPVARRDGQPVSFEREPTGLYTAPAVPGEWEVELGPARAAFTVEP